MTDISRYSLSSVILHATFEKLTVTAASQKTFTIVNSSDSFAARQKDENTTLSLRRYTNRSDTLVNRIYLARRPALNARGRLSTCVTHVYTSRVVKVPQCLMGR